MLEKFGKIFSMFQTNEVRRDAQFFEDAEKKLAALDYAAAKAKALELLSDETKYRCVPKAQGETVPQKLPTTVRDLFERYSEIQTLGPAATVDIRLSLTEVGSSFLGQEYIKIGTNVDQTELLVVEGDERVFDFGPSQDGENPEDYSSPSVYHWILNNSLIYHDYLLE